MGQQRVIQGIVVSDKMDKTIVVTVERRKKHPLYHKVMSATERFKAHDEENQCRLGDVVNIQECRPMSKDKRWRVISVVTRGDVADINPQTIGKDIERTAQVAPKSEVQE
jgi:small subunit ribosomal protein S17